jgi:predicted glycogen debranching enzyme
MVVRRLSFHDLGEAQADPSLEWLVTNGLGGYASGPVAGGITRRYHGLLVAALPAPLGRTVCLTHLRTQLLLGGHAILIDHPDPAALRGPSAAHLSEFRLEQGLPVWRYEAGPVVLERRVVMPHRQNTVHVLFELIEGPSPLTLRVEPLFRIRGHEDPVSVPDAEPARVHVDGNTVDVALAPPLPVVLWLARGEQVTMCLGTPQSAAVEYPVERKRGYDHTGTLWSAGWIELALSRKVDASLSASTEPKETLGALLPRQALGAELTRRDALLAQAGEPADPIVAELTLAADQFLVTPTMRSDDVERAQAEGEDPRTIIAGYHWFTDWGRDTMISLEGLTLATGRAREARGILTTFARYVRDGLIPNLFPEGGREGLYHTADATLWFFHAIDRYMRRTNDQETIGALLPTLVEILERHLTGTRFGIGVDPADGLMRQGAAGYQLTWMDAKVGDWVVTPRRGKAVEINALWYNALRLAARWLRQQDSAKAALRYEEAADRAQRSFNERFWNAATESLFDVIDGEDGNDPACRPNQIFAVSLPHAVLGSARWPAVLNAVERELLTPVGLRSLAPSHPSYQPTYDGDLRARDAAYHQGTVWAWLIGPFLDAWRKVHTDEDDAAARRFLEGFLPHLSDGCVGSINEIFDAEPPFTPRGCIAQAWSVAEVLRCWRETAGR